MYTNCDEIFKITIPATRVAVARNLHRKHRMSQSEIAKELGVAQAAVSKYISGDYSRKISRIAATIESKKLESGIVRMIVAKKDKKSIAKGIDQLASSGILVKEVLKVL